MTQPKLPSAFAEFEPFAGKWCLATEPERWAARLGTPMPQLREFYDAFRGDQAFASLESMFPAKRTVSNTCPAA